MTMAIYRKLSVSLFLLTAACTALAQDPAPRLYAASTEAGAKLYILGGTQVPPGHAWLTPAIEQALAESDELIVEVPPADIGNGIPSVREEVIPGAGAALHPMVQEEGYGNLGLGDYLDVAMGERSIVESQRLGLQVRYRDMQPWLAWFTFNDAFWSNYDLDDPQDTMVGMARDAGKPISALFPTRADYYGFFGEMYDIEQTQLFQSMYNTFDWQRDGEYEGRYTWTAGAPDDTWIRRTQEQTPDYYFYMYERQHPIWAEQLTQKLAEGGTLFLYLNADRTVGDHSMQWALREAGLKLEEAM